MIYLTGDLHGAIDIKKLSFKNFPEGRMMNKNDYIIILGDFGLIWDIEPSKKEKYWFKWLEERPWTTLFLDGNHENFDRLYQFPVQNMLDGKVRKVGKSVFHLCRGEVFTIEGLKFFVMGGAQSTDKEHRVVGISWWKEEEPSYQEFEYGLDNLEKHGNKVDFILSHTAPQRIIEEIFKGLKGFHDVSPYGLTKFLDQVSEEVAFKQYYFGHFHEDNTFSQRFICLYDSIHRIT